jgi:hypothetical protein
MIDTRILKLIQDMSGDVLSIIGIDKNRGIHTIIKETDA